MRYLLLSLFLLTGARGWGQAQDTLVTRSDVRNAVAAKMDTANVRAAMASMSRRISTDSARINTCVTNSSLNAALAIYPTLAQLNAAIAANPGPAGPTGATGAKGDAGATGATGPAGTAATVAVGSVTALAAGSAPTVSNAGTATAAIFNFGLPASSTVYLANVAVAQTATVALLAGVRKVTISGVTGLQAGDRVLLTPTASTPVGYALADVVATAAGTMEVSFTGPALALGASFSIPCKVTVFR